jgi:hypothetical protein
MRNRIGRLILLTVGAASIFGGALGLAGIIRGTVLISAGAIVGGIGLIQILRQIPRREKEPL